MLGRRASPPAPLPARATREICLVENLFFHYTADYGLTFRVASKASLLFLFSYSMHPDTIITIGRQFGSGARSIAKQLARSLNIPYYDRELIVLAAQKSGLDENLLKHREEKPCNPLCTASWYAPFCCNSELQFGQKVFLAQFNTIRELSEKGGCVIVGRCADFVLAKRPHVVRVFLHAPLETRVQRIMERMTLDENQARRIIRETEKNRAAYYDFFTDRKWGATETYDLCVNTDGLSEDDVVRTIRLYAQARCPNA